MSSTTEGERSRQQTGGGSLTQVFILEVSPRLALQLGHVLALGGEILDKHLLLWH